jgi:hypothetical protein
MKRVEHAAVAQDDERLVKAVVIALRTMQDLFSPIGDHLVNLPAQHFVIYWADQSIR